MSSPATAGVRPPSPSDGATVSTVNEPSSPRTGLPQASPALSAQVNVPSPTISPVLLRPSQSSVAVAPVPLTVRSVDPPLVLTRKVQVALSDRSTSRWYVSCEPSPLGEKAPVPSSTSQVRG